MSHCLNLSFAALLSVAVFSSGCTASRPKVGSADGSIPIFGADLSGNLGSTDLANGGCGTARYEAHQAPAVMLVVLDDSASMADGNPSKYVSAAQAIVQALDQDIFDTMAVGLMAAPSGTTKPPACLAGLIDKVACAAPPFPQIPLKIAGNAKSNAAGVRQDIATWTANHSPDVADPDSTPMYAAIQNALVTLQGWPMPAKLMLMVVTDGSWDCTDTTGRAGYMDCNGCTDWEKPQNVISLVMKANKDPNKPVDTFIVGVPGADTFDQTACNSPPYHMRAALSAIAYAGSPNLAPANCSGKAFQDNSPDPMTSCHFDLTKGNFNTQALANTISQVRGKVLGCVFDLPAVDGGVVDQGEVNVNYSFGGGANMALKRRADPNNQCVNDGCWDYTQDGKVQLIGKACDDVKTNMNAKVEVILGCPTIIG